MRGVVVWWAVLPGRLLMDLPCVVEAASTGWWPSVRSASTDESDEPRRRGVKSDDQRRFPTRQGERDGPERVQSEGRGEETPLTSRWLPGRRSGRALIAVRRIAAPSGKERLTKGLDLAESFQGWHGLGRLRLASSKTDFATSSCSARQLADAQRTDRAERMRQRWQRPGEGKETLELTASFLCNDAAMRMVECPWQTSEREILDRTVGGQYASAGGKPVKGLPERGNIPSGPLNPQRLARLTCPPPQYPRSTPRGDSR